VGCLVALVVVLLSCVMIWFWPEIKEVYIPRRPWPSLSKSSQSCRIARACCCGMLGDARIEVDHVGEWTYQQASGCQHAIPGFCYIGPREYSPPTYEHYIAVKNRLQVQNFDVCVVKEERLMHAQHRALSPQRSVVAGLGLCFAS